MPEPSLQQLQQWMSLIVRHPENSETAAHTDEARGLIPRGRIVAGEIIKPSATMEPLRRMDVYNGGYLTRLVEALESDYDAVAQVLGDDAWFELARDYVTAHPSRHPNLNQLGKHLPAFLAQQGKLAHREFTHDLARLQWAVVESFDSPEFEPLDMTELRSLTQSQWADVVLQANPSVRLLHFRYPVNRYLQDFFDGADPAIPETLPAHVVAYRKEGKVWRLLLPEPIAYILGALIAGEPFARALTAGGNHEEDVSHWFQEWSADGIFAAAE